MTRDDFSNRPVIGVDLGGTNMQIGVVGPDDSVLGRCRRKTRAELGQDTVIDRLIEGVHNALEDAGMQLDDLAGLGIAVPGAIDTPNGVVLEAPNLKWSNAPIRDILNERFGRAVVLENDVNAAVWGEYSLGVGRGRADALGVWVGTGVGGGLVMNGAIYRGELFTAGEIGHTVIEPDGEKGQRILEDFSSRTGMSRTILRRLKKHPDSMMNELIDPKRGVAGSRKLAKAYTAGDALAVEVVDDAARLLGIAIANWVTVLAIDTVIIGGGVTEALGDPFIKRIRQQFENDVFPPRSRHAELLKTELEDDAGLLGAALLGRAFAVQHAAV